MPRLAVFISGIVLAAAAITPAASADITCKDYVTRWVHKEAEQAVRDVAKDNPSLKEMGQAEAVETAGETMMRMEQPQDKARGYLTLLFFGGDKGREIVLQQQNALDSEVERSHYNLALAVYQLRSDDPEMVREMRSYLGQIRDTEHVNFVHQYFWKHLIEECTPPQ